MSVFSPLALTQALPFLPLAQGDIAPRWAIAYKF